MPRDEDRRADDEWKREMLLSMSRLEGKFQVVSNELKSLKDGDVEVKGSVEALRRDMNGRIKKIEHTTFGNEEEGRIGLAEKVRQLDDVREAVAGDPKEGVLPLLERVRNLESGWAKLTAVAVLGFSVLVEGLKWAGHMLYAAFISGKTPPHVS